MDTLLPPTAAQDLADLWRLLRYVESRRLVAGLRWDERTYADAEALRHTLYQALRALQDRRPSRRPAHDPR